MAYSRMERHLAAVLDSAPGLRRVAKYVYQRANYWLRGGGGPRVDLDPGVEMLSIPPVVEGVSGSSETFFGYFGISPWSADERRFVFHQLNDAADGRVDICVFDRASGSSVKIARSRAWTYQQGSMAQWVTDRKRGAVVIFNDYVNGALVSRLVSPSGGERTVPWPIQAVHPAGHQAISINYLRLAEAGSEYGYPLPASNFSSSQSFEDDGIWSVDLQTGRAALVISLQQLVSAQPGPEAATSKHKINHVVYSPRGSRIVFMHRWVGPRGRFSRLYSANADGSELRLLMDYRMVSHYAWRDEQTLLVWARAPEHGDRYYLLDVTTAERSVFGKEIVDRFGDGHPSFSPDGKWVLTDSYPDRGRIRRLFIADHAGTRVFQVAALFAPWKYDGATRCDLHPRWSPSGNWVSIDSSHEGLRRTYILDVRSLMSRL